MTEQKIELKMIRMSEVQSQEIEWLWYPFIPYGKLTTVSYTHLSRQDFEC